MSAHRPPRVYPVIHVSGVGQVLGQVRKAVAHHVDGVFLIDHDSDDARLVSCIAAVREVEPELFLGANVIRRSPDAALAILDDAFPDGVPLDALWTDSAGVGLTGVRPEFERFAELRRKTGWRGLHFGGVAFKYQQPVAASDLPDLGRAVREHVDVPTTSGPGTGQPTDRGKLEALRLGLGPHPLAMASGAPRTTSARSPIWWTMSSSLPESTPRTTASTTRSWPPCCGPSGAEPPGQPPPHDGTRRQRQVPPSGASPRQGLRMSESRSGACLIQPYSTMKPPRTKKVFSSMTVW